MIGKKEIRSQISSIKNTQVVTKAMNMVAISKMRKSEVRMAASRPYAQTIRKVIGHVALGNLEYQHPYLEVRAVNKVGYLVVSTDRGLCGSLNAELFKAALTDMHTWIDQGVAVELALVGTKAISFFAPMKPLSVLTQVSGLGDKPEFSDLIGLVNLLLQAYKQGTWDRLYLIGNKFVNTIVQRVQIDQLLPVSKCETPEIKGHGWDYLYEPNAKILLDTLLTRFIESQIYQAVIENLACEQAARMVAMQNATDNAGSLLKELQLTYNKTRQAGITQELSEIVAGAAAV